MEKTKQTEKFAVLFFFQAQILNRVRLMPPDFRPLSLTIAC
jgi:hypothetical protein